MEEQIPKYHETFIPILKVLSDCKTIHVGELAKRVLDEFYRDLPQDLLDQKTKSGDLLVLNRIYWGKAYLKQAKMLSQPERAMVRITDKGKSVLERGSLTLKELKDDSDYKDYENAKETKDLENSEVSENASPEDLVDSGVNAIERQIKNELLDKLKGIDPFYFEKVVLVLLNKMGYGDFQETSKTGDGGIDGIINQDQLGLEKIYVQAKRYSENKVHETNIRDFIGAMSGDTSKGIFVTTSSFDSGAVTKAREAHHKIVLIDGPKLVDLMYKFGVGVQTRSTYDVKEVDEDFFEQN